MDHTKVINIGDSELNSDWIKRTKHIQMGSTIYCHRLVTTVDNTQEHFENHCRTCPHFAGSAQGDGVECAWYDGTDRDIAFANEETTETLAELGHRARLEKEAS